MDRARTQKQTVGMEERDKNASHGEVRFQCMRKHTNVVTRGAWKRVAATDKKTLGCRDHGVGYYKDYARR